MASLDVGDTSTRASSPFSSLPESTIPSAELDILRDFDLAHLVGYFTTDNASPNDTLLESLAKNLLVEYGARINPKKRQIRCLGHIINLSLSAFLFADNKTAL